jgi:hypothetical protein
MIHSHNGGGPGDGWQDLVEAERALLDAARPGRLAQHLAADPERANAALYALISEVVYQRLTRPRELDRGHYRCAAGSHRMDPDCHDRHQDDSEAAVAYVKAHADEHFENLRGWVASRLAFITVDAYRRRRTRCGALQRPRLPRWLADEIGADLRLRKLSVDILEWVGVPTTAGNQTWPLRAWSQQWSQSAPEPEISEAEMLAEVDRALAAMRTKPKWYSDYVERPLGHKQPPLMPAQHSGANDYREPEYVQYFEPDQVDDAQLSELAAAALEAITEQIGRGAAPGESVSAVLGLVFGADESTGEMDRLPGDGRTLSPRERAAQLILDPDVLDRVLALVLDLLAQDSPKR